MATSFDKRINEQNASTVKMGPQPFNRDSALLAFGSRFAASRGDGQLLAGSGALVFEGEVLEMPSWH